MKKLISTFGFLLTCSAQADYCAVSKVIEHNFEPGSYAELQMKALAGSLEVIASEDDHIHFWGKACSSDAQFLDMMDTQLGNEDDSLILETIIPYHQDDFDPEYASIDIELRIPSKFPLRIQDSSGDVLIENVHLRSIDDSSGDIRLRNTTSDLTIRDSSGQILVREHAGSLTVYDSSGSIEISELQGNITIPGDSSGDIEIDETVGDIHIESDGSGDIEIENVTGDVLIGQDGSGDIDIAGINGKVEVSTDGSGGIEVTDVSGAFTVLNKGSGGIRHRGIQGKVDIPQ